MIDCNTINIKKGSKGDEVKEVQNYLQFLGIYKGKIDGECGDVMVTSIKLLQSRCNLKQDGWFGKLTCQKSGINGQDLSNTIQTIEAKVFKDMIERYKKYVETNNKEPQIIYLNIENKYRYVTLTKFKEMLTRWNAFIKTNKREPKFMNIRIVSVSSTNSEDQKFIEAFSDAVGKKIKTFREGYNAIKNRKYLYYYNDIYTQATALKRLKNKTGLNCSDISQLLYRLAKAFGIEVHYVHLICKSGGGHIIIEVKENGKWVWVDGAAALSSGKAFGQGWCYNGKVIGRDDGWLMSDDGKT